jgi:uncharacterized glyoxalase superfamily protein PhnB
VNGDDGAVRYAELTFGNGMIMLGPVEDLAVDRFMTQPANTGGAETQICYLFVADAVAHCARAKAAGAEIVLDVEDADSHGRGYSCRDPEGHIWNFGTYDPGKGRFPGVGGVARANATRRGRRIPERAIAAMFVVSTCAMVMHWPSGTIELNRFELAADAPMSTYEANASLLRERDVRIATERAAEDAKKQLIAERKAREAAERLVRNVREHLNQVRAAMEVGERSAADVGRDVEDARGQLSRARDTAEAEQRAAQETLSRISALERASDTVRDQLAAERSAKEAAERSAQEAQLAREKLARKGKERK